MARMFFVLILVVFTTAYSTAQYYENDSLKIVIQFRNKVSVKNVEDLNIAVTYISKASKRSINVYEEFGSAYRSTSGNCYYELYIYDSVLDWYRNITLDVMPIGDRAQEFKNEEEMYRFDFPKIPLKPAGRRTLTFNLLKHCGPLAPGKYKMRLYLRAANNYGFDSSGKIILNSMTYLESSPIFFTITKQLNFQYKTPKD